MGSAWVVPDVHERMNSVLLTLWVSNSGSGGASTSNGGLGGTMVASGKDVDHRMGMGNISQLRISGVAGTIFDGPGSSGAERSWAGDAAGVE